METTFEKDTQSSPFLPRDATEVSLPDSRARGTLHTVVWLQQRNSRWLTSGEHISISPRTPTVH